jgi:hypothetical protein
MKKTHILTVLAWIFLLSGRNLEAQQHVVLSAYEENLFDNSDDFEEPAKNIKIVRRRKPTLTLKDLPFYTKLFCSYVYEEKIKKWYAAVAGYMFVSKHSKSKRKP